MSGLLSSSLGRKLIMSVTGLFLMLFLTVHLSVNLLLVFGNGELFNHAAHFMATNPAIKIMEPILAAGFIIHIIYASFITIKNQKARPVKYAVTKGNELTSWSSKNMYILGAMLLIFMVIHMANFFWKIKFGEMPQISYDNGLTYIDDTYTLVAGLFINYWMYDVLYIIGGILLGLHLSHGFWSAFQTIGWNGNVWIKRLEIIAKVFAVIIATGFSIIPLFFLFFK